MTLKTEADKAGEALTVYASGMATRRRRNRLIPRVSAALMGHSLRTYPALRVLTDAETIRQPCQNDCNTTDPPR